MKKIKITFTLALAISIASCSSPKAVVKKETTLTIPTFRMITMPNGKSFKLNYQVCSATDKKSYPIKKAITSDWERYDIFNYDLFDESTFTQHDKENTSLLEDIVRNTDNPEKETDYENDYSMEVTAKNGLLTIPQHSYSKEIQKPFDINAYYYEIFDINNTGFYHADVYLGPKPVTIPLQFIKENSEFVIRYSLIKKWYIKEFIHAKEVEAFNKRRKKRYYRRRDVSSNSKNELFCSDIKKGKIIMNVPFLTSMKEIKKYLKHKDPKSLYILTEMAKLGEKI